MLSFDDEKTHKKLLINKCTAFRAHRTFKDFEKVYYTFS